MKKTFLIIIASILFGGFFVSCNKNETIKVTTYQPREVGAYYAKVEGKITSTETNQELWDYGICWGEEPNPDLSGNSYSRAMVDLPYHPTYTTPIEFDWTIVGLEPETEYHIRMFAAKDQNTILYGQDKKFITKKEGIEPLATP